MTTFSELSLDPRVLQAVSEAGYETPTPIQVQAIPHALEGRDVLGIAQTGTGKTASFVLPMVTHLANGRARARMPRSLVLCPTRELAAQVAENFEKYSKHLKLTMALLIGGVSFKDQDKLIDRGVDVLIATPGRLLDHFERGKLMMTGVQIMVVDEADRMLDMGFIPDIERIFKLVPFTRQTLFFSATMAPEITRITQEFLHNPVRVEVARQATTSETIEQFVCKHVPKRKDTGASEKRELLRRLIRAEGDALQNGIIFCNRKVDVDVLSKSLQKHGFDAAALHGDLDQALRTRILGKFRDGELKLLIASDVAARGLDIPNVSHVFNFDVPIHSEDYVHRIGRTGRAGRSGRAITLCLPHEQKYLDKIEELVKKAVPELPSPMVHATVDPEPAVAAAPERRRGGRKRQDEPRAAAPAEAPAVVAAPAPQAPRPAPVAGGRRGEAVTGMGDHVPAFLLREFRFDPAPEIEVAAPPLAEVPAEDPAAEPAKPRRAPRRRRAATAPEEGPEASPTAA
ncbi:MAG: DEAD/DEAH box helicase [Amaricoccus sp.]